MKSYRPYTPDQSFLLPPSPREWLPSGHLVFFVVEFVGQLDICSIERKLQASDARGERPPVAADAKPQTHTPVRLAMQAELASPRGRAAYARRKATVEPVFGQIRACRGFRQLSLRGFLKNRCEWLFVASHTTS